MMTHQSRTPLQGGPAGQGGNFPQQDTILLTFDVEDWFQVENFKGRIPYSSWPTKELRVERNTLELLDLLDEAPQSIRATFFVLGWIARRCPGLVREIHERGHEVASHGIDHHLCYDQEQGELRRDLIESKALLEDISGAAVVGYRAPSFSITDQVVQIVREAGYLYDSSYNSYEGHGRYGSLTLPPTTAVDPPLHILGDSFFEIPISNWRVGSWVIPWGGGGYFRLLPAVLHHIGVGRILKRSHCYTFYMHPWEIDPGQPRVTGVPLSFRFRHYINLATAKRKLAHLLASHVRQSFLGCREFVVDCGWDN